MEFNTHEEARNYLKPNITDYLLKAKNRGYVCPKCSSGTGHNGTGAELKDHHIKCFACGFYGDIFDVIEAAENVDNGEAFKIALNKYNVSILDDYRGVNMPKGKELPIMDKKRCTVNSEPHSTITEDKDTTDYAEYYLKANRNLLENEEGLNYLKSRGISKETAIYFNLGYDQEWKHPKTIDNKSVPATKRLIIPTSSESYVARAIEDSVSKEYRFGKVGAAKLFNIDILNEPGTDAVFIVEGEIDAISIYQATKSPAIALGSTANKNKLLSYLKDNPTDHPLILSLDNDEPGKEAQKTLEAELKGLNVFYAVNDINQDSKDPNEALIKDQEAFKERIFEAIYTTELSYENQTTEEQELYYKNNVANALSTYLQDMFNRHITPVSTGYPGLDHILDGGLHDGLYVIGAISSLGKTTLTLQIAENIANQGRDVLVFSLEMARHELIAKNISRMTFLKTKDQKHAKTTRGISSIKRYDGYSLLEKKLIEDSIEACKVAGQHLYITESMGEIGHKEIRAAVEKHIKVTGNKPVVIIDYLQILAPSDPRSSDKQKTDETVSELKKISRDYNIPIWAVSSFNRNSYNSKVNLASFKESGAIEYSADVLMGLQFQNMNGNDLTEEELDRLKRAQTRKLELKILKNRNGETGAEINFDYVPMFNYFMETNDQEWAKQKRL